MWLEEAEEPEDNVLALTVSFLSVQAIRFWISGNLPDVEGGLESHLFLGLLGSTVLK